MLVGAGGDDDLIGDDRHPFDPGPDGGFPEDLGSLTPDPLVQEGGTGVVAEIRRPEDAGIGRSRPRPVGAGGGQDHPEQQGDCEAPGMFDTPQGPI